MMTQFQRMVSDAIHASPLSLPQIERQLGWRITGIEPQEIAYKKLDKLAEVLILDLDELRSRWMAERYPGSVQSLINYLAIRARAGQMIVEPEPVPPETMQ